MVRSSKIEVFGMATVGAWLQRTIERRRVIKTLLDAGVESTQELERSGLCKAPNVTN